MVTRMEGLKETVQKNVLAVEDLVDDAENDRLNAENLMDEGKTAQQVATNQKAADKT